ncbi:ankyrin repeat-containing protein BDA1-like [Pistacia vera]|uniref:ankyrin repeat-containing protein BDA1-like n=1 Tax=Pistacia vera TaxID=55513 RepID=UPI001262AFEB|nr:ankyrin repeat-containing protein BDA1-like [Pistacia vera]
MNEKLMNCAEHGDVETLYSILGEDPYVLERLDQIPIVDTPIHRAASSGNTHLALEIASLKPSLAWKLNHLGFSPLHLALEHGNDQLVRGFIKTESELVRVKAKERITPLHYVAQTNNADLLAEFLTVCPSSIHDVTIRCETTVHLAIKNKNVDAFRVLLGFLRRNNMEDIMNFTDEDGNTALHIATSTNQPEIVKYLLRTGVNVSTRNLSGLTAMEISCSEEDSLKKKTERLLRRAKAVSGFSHDAADPTPHLHAKWVGIYHLLKNGRNTWE